MVPQLKCEYQFVDNGRKCKYRGMYVAEKEGFVGYVKERVSDRYHDVQGKERAIEAFEDLATTGFEMQIIVEIFSKQEDGKHWRVGEALAECFLEDEEAARFHYNSIRDLKNLKSNLTGADIVGFATIDEETVFMFGEVKTSFQQLYPPNVLLGRSGLIYQLEKIMSNDNIRDSLVAWLGFKVADLPETNAFRIDYRSALRNYISSNKKKVKVIGVLVRDVTPKPDDLDSRFRHLTNAVASEMDLELVALYIPISIKDLPDLVRRTN